MKQSWLLLALTPFFVACASVHPGYDGMAVDNKIPMKISAQTVGKNAEDDSFQLVEVTLENTSSKWVKISTGRVLIADKAAEEISLVVGNDLRDWAKAVANRDRIEAQNDGVLMASLVSAGALATALSKDKTVRSIGAISSAGGVGMAAHRVYNASLRDAEGVEQNPEDYITSPVSIPGKLFQRRWLVLNKPAGQLVRTLVVEFETATGEKDTYVVGL